MLVNRQKTELQITCVENIIKESEKTILTCSMERKSSTQKAEVGTKEAHSHRFRSQSVSGSWREKCITKSFRNRGAVRGHGDRYFCMRQTSRQELRRDVLDSQFQHRTRLHSTGSVIYPRRRLGQGVELNRFMPGGTPRDPLNLQAVARGEVIPPPSPIPEVIKCYTDPANNFIPVNQSDPLGLTQTAESSGPVAYKYKTHKRKKKRPEKKKKEGVSAAGDASAGFSESGMESDADISAAPGIVESDIRVSGSETQITDGLTRTESHSNSLASSECMELSAETDSSVVLKDPLLEISAQEITSGNAEQTDTLVQVPLDTSTISNDKTCANLAHDGGPAIKKRKAVDGNNVNFLIDSEPSVQLQASVQPGDAQSRFANSHRSDGQTAPLLNVPIGRLEPSSELNIMLYEEVCQQTQQCSGSLFEDEDEKLLSTRNSKWLRKVLKFDPVKDIKKEVKLQEKKHRDLIRQRKNPNLESPADSNAGTPSREPILEESRIAQINMIESSSVDHSKKSFPKSPVLKSLDAIVSPVMLGRSQSRKRRRTVSECSQETSSLSGDSASRTLLFSRPSSPDVAAAIKGLKPVGAGPKFKKKQEAEPNFQVPSAPKSIKFCKNPVFKHGNYNRYYGYRTPDFETDYRISFFKKEWFEGKDVLDIGCNTGHVTLSIAQLFNPQKIVGMDIDPNLIRIARQNIKSCQNRDQLRIMKKFPDSTAEYGPIEPLPALTNPSNVFPKNIMFMQGNYVLDRDEQLDHVKEEYDTILALSITKWLHLNTGDAGLTRAFHRMFKQLRPGGILILEPQSWHSYRRRKKLTETIYNNYNSIKLRPESFADYLIRHIGFCYYERIGLPYNPNKGFQRPLLMFTKFKDGSHSSLYVTPQYCYPHLAAPVPSTTPMLGSITAWMTNLAGYSSTPGRPDPMGHEPPWRIPKHLLERRGLNTSVLGPTWLATGSLSASSSQSQLSCSPCDISSLSSSASSQPDCSSLCCEEDTSEGFDFSLQEGDSDPSSPYNPSGKDSVSSDQTGRPESFDPSPSVGYVDSSLSLQTVPYGDAEPEMAALTDSAEDELLQQNAWENDPLTEADDDNETPGAEILNDGDTELLVDGQEQVASVDECDGQLLVGDDEQLLGGADSIDANSQAAGDLLPENDDDCAWGNGPIVDIEQPVDDVDGLDNQPVQQLQDEEFQADEVSWEQQPVLAVEENNNFNSLGVEDTFLEEPL